MSQFSWIHRIDITISRNATSKRSSSLTNWCSPHLFNFFNLYSCLSQTPHTLSTWHLFYHVWAHNMWELHPHPWLVKLKVIAGLCSWLTDNIDDPTGNFRGTPLTGWKVFLLLLCALLGIVVCAVVGAVVFQKRQERNKRFYWRVAVFLRDELFSSQQIEHIQCEVYFHQDCTDVYVFEALRWEW